MKFSISHTILISYPFLLPTSLPTKYLRFGSLLVTASSTTFATRSGVDPLCCSWPLTLTTFCIICEYGEEGSCDFLATTTAFEKLVWINPSSLKITFIPNGSSS